METRKNWPFLSIFNPFPSMPSIATSDGKLFQYLQINHLSDSLRDILTSRLVQKSITALPSYSIFNYVRRSISTGNRRSITDVLAVFRTRWDVLKEEKDSFVHSSNDKSDRFLYLAANRIVCFRHFAVFNFRRREGNGTHLKTGLTSS